MQLPAWIQIIAFTTCSAVVWAQAVPDIQKLSAASDGMAVYGATNLTLRGEAADGMRKLVKWDVGRWVTSIRDRGERREYQRIQEDASGRVQIYTATFDCSGPESFCVSRDAGLVYWRNRDTGVTWHVGYGVGGVSDNGEWAVTASGVPTPELRVPEVAGCVL